MKNVLAWILCIIFLPACVTSGGKTEIKSETEGNEMTKINITVNGSVFSAKFYKNDTTDALLTQFPLTLDMSELNGNEKYYYLPDKLPADAQQIGDINNGDLMLYGSDCLVLFYKSFSTSYNYTRIGLLDDATGLADALGSGRVEVTFTVTGETDATGDIQLPANCAYFLNGVFQ